MVIVLWSIYSKCYFNGLLRQGADVFRMISLAYRLTQALNKRPEQANTNMLTATDKPTGYPTNRDEAQIVILIAVVLINGSSFEIRNDDATVE